MFAAVSTLLLSSERHVLGWADNQRLPRILTSEPQYQNTGLDELAEQVLARHFYELMRGSKRHDVRQRCVASEVSKYKPDA